MWHHLHTQGKQQQFKCVNVRLYRGNSNVAKNLNSRPSRSFCQLAGALAEEGCSLDQIVVEVTEVLKGIGESLFHSL